MSFRATIGSEESQTDPRLGVTNSVIFTNSMLNSLGFLINETSYSAKFFCIAGYK